MKLDLKFDRVLAHPVEAVWASLTDPAALAEWLMANDFQPRRGHRFTFRDAAMPGWRGWSACEVLEIEPPRRMVWAWQGAEDDATTVSIELTPVPGGTRLVLHHAGDTDATLADLIASGWPGKLASLETHLATP